jgi:hypothetical protein
MRDLRRLVGELWDDSRCDAIAPAVLDAAVTANAKSCDRAVLVAYLRHFPSAHPAFERLRAAAALTAERRDWPWRARGQRWRLDAAQRIPNAETLMPIVLQFLEVEMQRDHVAQPLGGATIDVEFSRHLVKRKAFAAVGK